MRSSSSPQRLSTRRPDTLLRNVLRRPASFSPFQHVQVGTRIQETYAPRCGRQSSLAIGAAIPKEEDYTPSPLAFVSEDRGHPAYSIDRHVDTDVQVESSLIRSCRLPSIDCGVFRSNSAPPPRPSASPREMPANQLLGSDFLSRTAKP